MSDVLQQIDARTHLPALDTAIRLGLATLYGTAIAAMHWEFRRREGDRPSGLGVTLVLLCVLVAFVTFVIGNSVARAFGLVGALSIVRFRTTVSDTRDTSFVIFAVAVGMGVGAGFWEASLVALPVVGFLCFGAYMLNEWTIPATRGGRIKLRATSVADAEAALSNTQTWVRAWHIQSCTSGKKNGNIDLEYDVKLMPKADPTALVAHLRTQPGLLRVMWSARRST